MGQEARGQGLGSGSAKGLLGITLGLGNHFAKLVNHGHRIEAAAFVGRGKEELMGGLAGEVELYSGVVDVGIFLEGKLSLGVHKASLCRSPLLGRRRYPVLTAGKYGECLG